MTTKFKLNGLTCEACVKLASKRLERLAGVENVIIKLATGETEIIANHEISDNEAELVLTGSGYSIVKK